MILTVFCWPFLPTSCGAWLAVELDLKLRSEVEETLTKTFYLNYLNMPGKKW